MSESAKKGQQELTSIRDTVESIWVAIVLAFVLRAFVVEAFVIPTGSMAPRLLGEHLDLRCPACGYKYAFGWSSDPERHRPAPAGAAMESRSLAARCPTCGYDDPRASYISGGDRVLVMKYLYRFRPAHPWDVVVFKNPQDNRQNYIKRLIGLPGETIEIVHGDVFVKKEGDKEFHIRRKDDPKVQEAMWQVVFYNDYHPDPGVLAARNVAREPNPPIKPPVWDPNASTKDAKDAKGVKDVWKPAGPDARVFLFDGCPAGRQAELVFKGGPEEFLPRYGYNERLDVNPSVDIVSDLRVAASFFPKAADSALAMELSSFEHLFRGEVRSDGRVHLLYRRTDDGPAVVWTPLAADDVQIPPLTPGRGYEVALTNVDFRVTLWVDGKAVLVSADRDDNTPPGDRTRYPLDYRLLKQRLAEKDAKPIPQPQVRVAGSGGACEVRHLVLQRDVYYTSPSFMQQSLPPPGPAGDFGRELGMQRDDRGWGVEGHPITLARFPGHEDLDQFFVMGDNSPSSLDGRLWTTAAPTLRLYDETETYGDPNLVAGDVTWSVLAGRLMGAPASTAPTPGKLIWQALTPETQANLLKPPVKEAWNSSGEAPWQRPAVAELNALLAGKDFYDPQVWQAAGVKLPDRAAALAERKAAGGTLEMAELRALNRLALEAAVGDAVGHRWRTYQLGTVPRYSMIGKAIFVYWPAGFPVEGLVNLPILPNVGKMRLIR